MILCFNQKLIKLLEKSLGSIPFLVATCNIQRIYLPRDVALQVIRKNIWSSIPLDLLWKLRRKKKLKKKIKPIRPRRGAGGHFYEKQKKIHTLIILTFKAPRSFISWSFRKIKMSYNIFSSAIYYCYSKCSYVLLL